MRGIAVLLVALAFASTAFLAEPASAQSSGSLKGIICIQSPYASYPAGSGACPGGQGLPGATVVLSKAGTVPVGPAPLGPTESTATTDANGIYSFSGLADGTYAVAVSRTGFQSNTSSVDVAGATYHDVALVGESVTAKGLVSDPDAKPIPGAALNFCCVNTYVSASTGADGRFSVGVQAGYWSVDINAPGFQTTYQSLLIDGSELGFVLQPIPPQDAKVAGTVVDQDGAPVSGARVSLYNYGGCCYTYAEGDVAMGAPASSSSTDPAMSYRPSYSGENSTTTDSQGRFSMGAYSGENQLSVSKEGFASQSRSVTVVSGQTASVDVELLKFPEKTARITGQVVDAKTGKGVAHAYINVQSPQYGLYECSQPASAGDGSSGSSGTATGTTTSGGVSEPKPAIAIAPGEPYPAPGCAITIEDNGSFDGLVTPGYAIISVYVDSYASCSESHDADGSSSRTCGPEYYSWSASRSLAADGTTTLDIRLRSRPAPDAVVSGYVIDAESGKALPGAQISFSNQDNYGYGYATTDGDGSYSLRLRSGYHMVSVWSEGHLSWQGVLDVPSGDTPFDVEVTPGQESYGYCCYGPYYGGGGVAYASAEDGAKSSGMASATASPAPAGGLDSSSSQQGSQYEDLGGGLGPYDASKRQSQLEQSSDGTPGLGLVAILAALGAVLVLRRRVA